MSELPLLLFVLVLVVGALLMLRRAHGIRRDQGQRQTLNTRGPDDR